MSDPIPPLRLRVLMGLTDVFKAITPANGYTNDLSDFPETDAETSETVTKSRVARGRIIFGSDDPVPLVTILEMPHPDDPQREGPRASTTNAGPWPLLIQGWVEDDKDNPTDPAHWLLADVKMALAKVLAQYQEPARTQNILGVGHAIDKIHVGAGVVRPPDEVSAKAYFWLTLTLDLVEDMANPFA